MASASESAPALFVAVMGDERHANAAFKTDPLASPTDAAPFPPRAIIAGDQNKRIVKASRAF